VVDLPSLQREQLMLGEHAGLATEAQAAAFLARVAIALRYGPSESLPLASMYQATWRQLPGEASEPEPEPQRRATLLTNALLDRRAAVETNVIADRVALVDAGLAPAVIALRRRGKGRNELLLSDAARRVLAFLGDAERPTAGQVRAHLGVPPRTWPNPADDALAELQRLLLIDRGAADVPDAGAPYLANDGIPYQLFDSAHPTLMRKAGSLTIGEAAVQLLAAYITGAVFAHRQKLASMFKLCMSRTELDAALEALVAGGRLTIAMLDGKAVLVAAASKPRNARGTRPA
jgi:hypothetical protein